MRRQDHNRDEAIIRVSVVWLVFYAIAVCGALVEPHRAESFSANATRATVSWK